MTVDNPIQAAEAHIDPIIFAEALAELDWTPKAELKELVDIIRDSDNARYKMGAMQILRSRIIENLELSGAIQLVQERIRGLLPGGQVATSERSRYLTAHTASNVHEHLRTLDTERQDVPAPPSQTLEQSNDDDPEGPRTNTLRGAPGPDRVGLDDLANGSQSDGPRPVQPDERHRTPNAGDPPERSPAGPEHPACAGREQTEGDATTPASAAGAPPEAGETEEPEVEAGEAVEEPFKRRKPEEHPAFGRPLGRRTPTKPTIGGGICGPAPGTGGK